MRMYFGRKCYERALELFPVATTWRTSSSESFKTVGHCYLTKPEFLKVKRPVYYTALIRRIACTAWKVSKYGAFSGSYFSAFGLNTEYLSVFSVNAGKYGPGKTPYLDTFHVVLVVMTTCILHNTMLEATVKLHSH